MVGGCPLSIWAKGHRTQRPTIQNVNSFNFTQYRYKKTKIVTNTGTNTDRVTNTNTDTNTYRVANTNTKKYKYIKHIIQQSSNVFSSKTFILFHRDRYQSNEIPSLLYIYSVSSQHDALGSSCSQMLASMTGFIDEKSFENSPVSTFLSMVELYKLKIYVMLYL